LKKWKIATDQTREEFRDDLVYWLNIFQDTINNKKGELKKQSFTSILMSILRHLFIYVPNLYNSHIGEIYAIVLFLKTLDVNNFNLDSVGFKYNLGYDLPRYVKSIGTKDFNEDDGFLDYVLTKKLISIKPEDYYTYFDCTNLDNFLELTWSGLIMFEGGNSLDNVIPQLFAIIFPNAFLETPNMQVSSDMFETISGPDHCFEIGFMIYILIKTSFINEESLINM